MTSHGPAQDRRRSPRADASGGEMFGRAGILRSEITTAWRAAALALAAGTRLGPYEIREPLGAGGMGEVYRATDTKLQRDVAIKVLPSEVAQDAERLARFQREAQLLASLNHPHIAAIHGLEEAEGTPFLVLELVEGEDLQERLKRGAIPVGEAPGIARQIAEGLEEAHEKGIVHRDLKPANVKLTPDGKVKILDFGLAKAWEVDAVAGPSSDLSQSPTLAQSGTQAGVILGTAAYMSPEQARGKPVDKRADIWAFGVLLFEMLTGQRLFAGEEVSDTLASILKDEPDWTRLPAGTPRRLAELLNRCLQRDRRNRLRDIGDGRIELDEILAQPAGAAAPVSSAPRNRERLAWVGMAAFALSTLVLALVHVREPPQEPQQIRFAVPPPPDLRFSNVQFAISPDGRTLAFVGITADRGRLLGIRPLDSNEARLLPGTEGAGLPFWSPDSRFIGYFSDGKLKRVGASGGPSETLCATQAFSGASWSDKGVILFGSAEGIQRVDARGGSPSAVTTLDEEREEWGHSFPQFLPDGDHFLFLARSFDEEKEGVYVASLGSSETRRLLNSNLQANYLRSGHLLSVDRGDLWVRSFDADNLQVSDVAHPLTETVSFNAGLGAAGFSVSRNGVAAYRTAASFPGEMLLVWRSRDGGEPILIRDELIRDARDLRLSPDGQRLVLRRNEPGASELWVYPLDGRPPVPLTRGGDHYAPVWSPDGTRIVFRSLRRGGLFWVAADGGATEAESLRPELGGMLPGSWAPSGNELIAGARGRGILVLPFDGGQEPRLIANTEDVRGAPRLSPDGGWLAYVSAVAGQGDIWVRPYPGPGGVVRVTSTGGFNPVWSRDGLELFYLEGALETSEIRLMGVKRAATSEARFGAPQVVVDGGFASSRRDSTAYDVAPDGRFVMLQPTAASEAQDDAQDDQIVVVTNWFEELRRLTPTN